MNKTEQISRHEQAAGYRRFLKRTMNRLMRRLRKRTPEDAPRKRRYWGYS